MILRAGTFVQERLLWNLGYIKNTTINKSTRITNFYPPPFVRVIWNKMVYKVIFFPGSLFRTNVGIVKF